MSDKLFLRVMPVLILLLAAALVVQAFVGRARRADICRSQNTGLAVLHDVIVLAMTPPKGKTLTAQQVASITRFETSAFARITAARC